MPKSIPKALFTGEHRYFLGADVSAKGTLNSIRENVLAGNTAYDKL
jgi:hypothetical protein